MSPADVPRHRSARLAATVALVAAAGASAPPVASRHVPLPAAVRVTAATGKAPTGECRPGAPSDFDGDGTPDLAAGAPYATVRGRFRAGAVGVRRAAGVTWLSREGAARAGDGFGASLAAGDFDRDGCADLAVGLPDAVPGRRATGAEGGGAVQIFAGSPDGLRPGPLLTVRSLHRRSGTDRFGASLAAADLDRDRDDELVVGAPGLAGGGGVAVFGLRGRGLRPGPLLTQRTSWIGQRASETDGFGTVLAAGDFDGDRRAEIAAGAPGDGSRGAGTVTVLDPLERSARYVVQDGSGVAGTAERADGFGSALAAADFDGDGRDDLAVGSPGENREETAAYAEGAVQVLAGPSMRQLGPTFTGRSRGGPFDHFGDALAAADLTGDGVPDLAVGAPGRSAVRILRGARGTGPTGRGALTIGSPFGPSARFGDTLSVTGRGRRATLVIGAPGAYAFGGAVTVLPALASRPASLPFPARGLTGFAFP
ncbi:FG-GAP-like repeat-containing protein [Actinomadura fibrosa]|uniref:FG-GAP-like repeat-containing protein n=1 Tax=Actinomadura fibrosa TaxID=111802 RepID=A0ABW2XED8_9ACTN|nr:FG-GAP-like repeat-containing protein [Actinomadura fibrosa]